MRILTHLASAARAVSDSRKRRSVRIQTAAPNDGDSDDATAKQQQSASHLTQDCDLFLSIVMDDAELRESLKRHCDESNCADRFGMYVAVADALRVFKEAFGGGCCECSAASATANIGDSCGSEATCSIGGIRVATDAPTPRSEDAVNPVVARINYARLHDALASICNGLRDKHGVNMVSRSTHAELSSIVSMVQQQQQQQQRGAQRPRGDA